MCRRFLALLLCALMMVGLMPTTALAATKTVSNATDLQNAIKNAGNGDTIKLGGNITFSGDSGLRTMTNLYQSKNVTYELTYMRGVKYERYIMTPTWTQVAVVDDASVALPDSYRRVNTVTNEETGTNSLDGKYKPKTVIEHGDATAYLFVENKNLTIDLNGYTISSSRIDAYLSILFVTGSSSVTIMDSRSGGRITSSGSAVTAHGGEAKVTIKSGSFQGDQSAVAAIYNGIIDIQGGSFTGYSQAEKTVTTYHNKSDSREGFWDDDKFLKTKFEETYDFTITRTRQSGILYVESDGAITVSGSPTFQVPGNGKLDAYERVGGSIKISGGTFNISPESNYIASGYRILQKDDGTYEVVTQNDSRFVAEVNTPRVGITYCTSLSGAIKLAQEGSTVTLLQNVNGEQILNNNSRYYLNLNGHTITGNVTVKTGNVTIRNGTISYTGTGNALKTEGSSAVLTADCIVNAPNGTALSAGYGNNGGTVNAIGGTYTGKTTVATSAGGTLTITGGRYKPDDPSAYLAEGLYAVMDSERFYTVTDSPFIQIWNKDDLLAFAKKVNDGDAGANAILMDDIDLSGVAWTPIKNGTSVYYPEYTGTFNGNGYSIKNLNSTSGGLFRSIGKGGVVSNVTIASGNITGYGAIAGSCYGTIQGCFNYAPVTTTGGGVGGIVGYLYNGTVERCGNHGDIKGKEDVGGIVGHISVLF